MNLGLSLDADVEGLDAGGEGACDALAGEGVEEVEARLGEAEEAAPLLDHRDARLVHAPTEEEEGGHHLSIFLSLPSFLSSPILMAGRAGRASWGNSLRTFPLLRFLGRSRTIDAFRIRGHPSGFM